MFCHGSQMSANDAERCQLWHRLAFRYILLLGGCLKIVLHRCTILSRMPMSQGFLHRNVG